MNISLNSGGFSLLGVFRTKRTFLQFIKGPILKILIAWYRGPAGVFDGWKLINLSALFYSLINLLKRRLFWFYTRTSHASIKCELKIE